jgi:hypothetical protein
VESGTRIFVRDSDGASYPFSPYTKFSYPGFGGGDYIVDATQCGPASAKNFFFSGVAVKSLESIKKRCHSKNNADAIKIALTAFAELLFIYDRLDDIVLIDRQGNEALFNPHNPESRLPLPKCRTNAQIPPPTLG